MLNNKTIETIKKLSYIDDVIETKKFSYKVYYANRTKHKNVSKKSSFNHLQTILNNIKGEIDYEDEKTSKTLPFCFV